MFPKQSWNTWREGEQCRDARTGERPLILFYCPREGKHLCFLLGSALQGCGDGTGTSREGG